MEKRKVNRYYSECGKGFWKKEQALNHEKNCKCWKNPKIKGCLSCINKSIKTDSNGMELEPQFLQYWKYNDCIHSDAGVEVHKDFDYIRKNCLYWESKKESEVKK